MTKTGAFTGLLIASLVGCSSAFTAFNAGPTRMSMGGGVSSSRAAAAATATEIVSSSTSSSSSSRREVLSSFGRSLALVGAASVATSTAPAFADGSIASFQKAYFRYVPRIKEGMDWYKTDLKALIDKEDYAGLSAVMEDSMVDNASTRKPEASRVKSREFDRKLKNPLNIWATTFSAKASSPKVRALQEQVALLEAASLTLQGVADYDKPTGMFGPKQIDLGGKSKKEVATAAYNDGVTAIQEYIKIANKGLGNSLNQVTTPFD